MREDFAEFPRLETRRRRMAKTIEEQKNSMERVDVRHAHRHFASTRFLFDLTLTNELRRKMMVEEKVKGADDQRQIFSIGLFAIEIETFEKRLNASQMPKFDVIFVMNSNFFRFPRFAIGRRKFVVDVF